VQSWECKLGVQEEVKATESAKFDHSHQDYDLEKKKITINKIENNARQMI
jgi:hypothetical protein